MISRWTVIAKIKQNIKNLQCRFKTFLKVKVVDIGFTNTPTIDHGHTFTDKSLNSALKLQIIISIFYDGSCKECQICCPLSLPQKFPQQFDIRIELRKQTCKIFDQKMKILPRVATSANLDTFNKFNPYKFNDFIKFKYQASVNSCSLRIYALTT